MTLETEERERREPPPATSVTVTIGVGFWRNFFKWAAGILLVFVLGFLLLSLNAAQLTEKDTAHKVLRRAAASLTEIDALLEDGYSELMARAEESPEEEVRLPHYPIDVPLSAQEAEKLSTPELRDVLLDRSAAKLYAEGYSAFRGEEREPSAEEIAVLSPPGAVRYTVGLVTEDNYDTMRTVTAILTGVAAFLALLLVLLSKGYGRLTSLGIAVTIAAFPFLIVSLTVRFILRLASDAESDYLAAQLYELGKDVAWLPIRNGIAFAGLGVIFLTLGVAFSLLSNSVLNRR